MFDTKAWYASKTIWAGLIVALASLLRLAGIALDEQAQADLLNLVEPAVTLIGGLVAIVGRVKATQAIETSSANAPEDDDGEWWLKSLIGAAILCSLLAVSGCATPAFVRGVEAEWRVIGPEYVGYVQSDPKLDEQDQEHLIDSARMMDELIAAEKSRK